MACGRCGYAGDGWKWTPFAMGVVAGFVASFLFWFWVLAC